MQISSNSRAMKITSKGLATQRISRNQEVLYLLHRTIKELWTQFKELERPFLVKSGRRAEEIRKGDYWAESDVEEKAGTKNDGNVATDGGNYYLTDMSHRWIWWQNKNAVKNLASMVQRVQIRRIERDLFETEELVRRCLGKLSGDGGDGSGYGDGSGSSDSDGGGGGGVRKRRGSEKVRSRSVSAPPVRRSASQAGGRDRVVEERESVKVRGDTTDGPAKRPPPRDRDRDRGSRYEVVRPGRMYVDVQRPGDRDRRGSVYVQGDRSR